MIFLVDRFLIETGFIVLKMNIFVFIAVYVKSKLGTVEMLVARMLNTNRSKQLGVS